MEFGYDLDRARELVQETWAACGKMSGAALLPYVQRWWKFHTDLPQVNMEPMVSLVGDEEAYPDFVTQVPAVNKQCTLEYWDVDTGFLVARVDGDTGVVLYRPVTESVVPLKPVNDKILSRVKRLDRRNLDTDAAPLAAVRLQYRLRTLRMAMQSEMPSVSMFGDCQSTSSIKRIRRADKVRVEKIRQVRHAWYSRVLVNGKLDASVLDTVHDEWCDWYGGQGERTGRVIVLKYPGASNGDVKRRVAVEDVAGDKKYKVDVKRLDSGMYSFAGIKQVVKPWGDVYGYAPDIEWLKTLDSWYCADTARELVRLLIDYLNVDKGRHVIYWSYVGEFWIVYTAPPTDRTVAAAYDAKLEAMRECAGETGACAWLSDEEVEASVLRPRDGMLTGLSLVDEPIVFGVALNARGPTAGDGEEPRWCAGPVGFATEAARLNLEMRGCNDPRLLACFREVRRSGWNDAWTRHSTMAGSRELDDMELCNEWQPEVVELDSE